MKNAYTTPEITLRILVKEDVLLNSDVDITMED